MHLRVHAAGELRHAECGLVDVVRCHVGILLHLIFASVLFRQLYVCAAIHSHFHQEGASLRFCALECGNPLFGMFVLGVDAEQSAVQIQGLSFGGGYGVGLMRVKA